MRNRSKFSKQILNFLILSSLILIGASSTLPSKYEDSAFQLSNYSVFKPGENVIVNIYYYNKNISNQLKLSLFKIEDPIRFFINLSTNQRRYNFDIWGKDNQFLLENSFLVKSWNYSLDKRTSYFNKLEIGIIEKPGIYILQVRSDLQVAYCPILVTNIAVISKEFNSQILATVVDIKTGKILKNAEFFMIPNLDKIQKYSPESDGVLLLKTKDLKSDFQLFAKIRDELIPFNVYSFLGTDEAESFLGYVYTNQPIYRPGQEVNFKAILRTLTKNKIKNFENHNFLVKITSPQNKNIFSQEMTTNEFGTLNGNIILSEEAELGTYLIEIQKDNKKIYGSFLVEEYKKPEFKVFVHTSSNQYALGDTIKGIVSAEYYFGKKVVDGAVKVNIYKQRFWLIPFPQNRTMHFNSFQKIYPPYNYENELVQQITGFLNQNGEFEFSFEPNYEKESDFRYKIVAEVSDQSRRTILGSKEVVVSRGLFTISASTEKYFYLLDEEVKIRIKATDFENNPVRTDFLLIITYPDDKLLRPAPVKDTLFGKTNADGTALVLFKPRGSLTGHYAYTVIAKDKRNNEISSYGSFYYGNHKEFFSTNFSNQIEIVTDKDIYEFGETVRALIYTPTNTQEFLLTIETNEVLDYKILETYDNVAKFEFKVSEILLPNFNISVCFLNDKNFYQNSKSVEVAPNDKMLKIDIKTDKKKYKPEDKVDYFIQVRNSKGQLIKDAELSLSVTDESLYDLANEQNQSIEKFFYSPRYFYLPSYSTTNNYYFSSASRPITYLEQYYKDNLKEPSDIRFDLNFKGEFISEDSIFNNFKLKCLLVGTKKAFSALIDSIGSFEFKNIPADKYQLFIVNSKGSLIFIKDLIITKFHFERIKINELILEKIKNLIQMDSDSEIRVAPHLREDGVFNLNNQPLKLEKSFSNISNGIINYEIPHLRKEFLDAVFWSPVIKTNSKGIAKISIKLPENLGTWRATVKGVTKETLVGQEVFKIISTKNLLVRIESPRFLTQGDETTISTIVHNYLNATKRTRIDFYTKNTDLIFSKISSKQKFKNYSSLQNVYEVDLQPDSEIRIDWIIRTNKNHKFNEAIFKATALTNEESDAIEIKIPINPYGIEIQKPIVFDNSKDTLFEEFEFEIPEYIDLNTLKLKFSLSPTLMSSLLNTIDELVHYPYGCVEQTMSRFLPVLFVNNLIKTQNIKYSSTLIENVSKYTNAGIRRLIEFQQSDGGWGWWKNDRSNPFMTAYVTYGLNFALSEGYNVDKLSYKSAILNLENQILEWDLKKDLTTLSFMIYSYSSINQKNLFNNYEKIRQIFFETSKQNLDNYSLSLLTLASLNFNEISLSNNLINKLIQNIKQDELFAFFGEKNEYINWQNDNIQTTAFALKSLLKLKPQSDLIPKMVRWLLMKRQGFGWNSTQTNSFTLIAMMEYLKFKNELIPNYKISVSLNGNRIFDKTFKAEDIFNQPNVNSISNSEKYYFKKGKNKITINKYGKGSVYFSGLIKFFIEDFEIEQNLFSVDRKYYLLQPKQYNDKILVFTKKIIENEVFVGQDILVETTIKAKDKNLEYLISEDMLPAGFEIVKDIDSYQIIDKSNNNNHLSFYNYYHREYRDDKVAIFVNRFNDEITYRYIIKAQIPGTFNISPANSYLMYYPGYNGYSDVKKIIVKDY